jgi:hypothetical protein
MKTLKGIGFVVGISAFQFFLVALGLAMTGAGDGSSFFGEALLAPFSVSETQALWGLLIWPIVGTLLVFRRFQSCRIAAAALLIVHYVGIVLLGVETDWYSVGRVWSSLFLMVLFLVVAYFGGQIFLWSLITRTKLTDLSRS